MEKTYKYIIINGGVVRVSEACFSTRSSTYHDLGSKFVWKIIGFCILSAR